MKAEHGRRWLCLLAVALSCALVWQAHALSIPEPAWRKVARSIKVGDSKRSVSTSMKRFSPVKVNTLVDVSAFTRRRFGFLRDQNALVWKVQPDAPAMHHVVAVFSAEQKLIDLLYLEREWSVVALVDGEYAKGMRSLKKDTKVQEVFRRFGKADPTDYRQDSSGKWVVEFLYDGCPENVWKIIVDAGTGTVIKKEHVN